MRVSIQVSFTLDLLLPAEYNPLGDYQDWCWNSLPCFLLLSLVFSFSHPWLLFSPGFSLLPTLGYYSALGFLFFPPWAIIQPLVFHFYPPLAKILSFSSLVYNISHPWFFTFFNPWLLFSPRFFLLPTLGYYPALGFLFVSPLAVIQP